MNTLQIQWGRRKKQILSYLLGMLVSLLFGLAVELVIYLFEDVNSIVPLALIATMCAFVFTHIIAGSFYLTLEFQLAVTMGITRKNFVRNYLRFAAVEMTAYYMIFVLIYQLEKFLWKSTLGLGMAEEVLMIIEMKPLVWMAIGFEGMVVLEFINAALLMKFGPKILWIYWLVFMIPSIRAHWDAKCLGDTIVATGIVDFVSNIGMGGKCAFVLVIEILLGFLAYKMLKRQQIA